MECVHCHRTQASPGSEDDAEKDNPGNAGNIEAPVDPEVAWVLVPTVSQAKLGRLFRVLEGANHGNVPARAREYLMLSRSDGKVEKMDAALVDMLRTKDPFVDLKDELDKFYVLSDNDRANFKGRSYALINLPTELCAGVKGTESGRIGPALAYLREPYEEIVSEHTNQTVCQALLICADARKYASRPHNDPSIAVNVAIASKGGEDGLLAVWLLIHPCLVGVALPILRGVAKEKNSTWSGNGVKVPFTKLCMLEELQGKVAKAASDSADEDVVAVSQRMGGVENLIRRVEQYDGDIVTVPFGYMHVVCNKQKNLKLALDIFCEGGLHMMAAAYVNIWLQYDNDEFTTDHYMKFLEVAAETLGM